MARNKSTKKTRPVGIRCTDEQYAILSSAASKQKCTKSEYLISSFLSKAANDAKIAEGVNTELAIHFQNINRRIEANAELYSKGAGLFILAGTLFFNKYFK